MFSLPLKRAYDELIKKSSVCDNHETKITTKPYVNEVSFIAS